MTKRKIENKEVTTPNNTREKSLQSTFHVL